MIIDFISLTFIWLLPLTASNVLTSDQSQVYNNITTAGTKTTQERNPTMSPKMSLTNTQTAATSTTSISSHLNSTRSMGPTTEEQSEIINSITRLASNPTSPASVPPVLTNSTQSQSTGKTSSTQVKRDESTHPSTFSLKSTNLFSTTTTIMASTTPEEDKPESMSPATGNDVQHSTGLYKTLTHIQTTKQKNRKEPSEKQANFKKGTNHGKVVAVLIGGSLLLMMVGFLVIFIKKRKLQKQQITTTDWAGPSPFLEGGADNGQVTLRSSNRISLASFLPLRLSKRLSLLPETDEELEDLTPATFGDKNQGTTSGRAVDENDGPESKGTTAGAQQMKSTGDTADTVENSVLANSLQTNNPVSKNNENPNLSQDPSANHSNLSGAMENVSAQMQP